jgi:hypothetical protein
VKTYDMETYEDLDVLIERAGEQRYRARVVNSPVGPADGEFELPFSDLELENFVLRLGQTRHPVRNLYPVGDSTNKTLEEFGGKLYSAVFSGAVSDCLHGSLAALPKESQGLRIRLHLADTPELISVPWEYLYDADVGNFLSLSKRTPIVRYLAVKGQAREPLQIQPPLRILVMISNPKDVAVLDVEKEWQKLKDSVQDLETRGLVQIERLASATLGELQHQLRRHDFHVFHFIGHGGFDTSAQDGVLVLEDEQGKGKPTSGTYLGTLLHDEDTIRLVVLNSCEGGRTSREDSFAGVGQSLVRQGVPAVVAMQFEITDQAAIILASEFYSALSDCYPVDAALAEARKAIYGQPNPFEWGTPVLYMRAQDGRIFDVIGVPQTSLLTDDAPNTANAAQASSPAVSSGTPLTATAVTTAPAWVVPLLPKTSSVLLGEQVSDLLRSARNLAVRVISTPASPGVRIASWSALVALIGFFLPWLGSDSGAYLLVRVQHLMPYVLFVPLMHVAVLVLRGWAGWRTEVRPGVWLLLLGIVSLFALNGFLARMWWASYGFIMTVAGSLGVLAGGIADLVPPAGDDRPASLRLSLGHIVTLIGAGLILFGFFLGIATEKNNTNYRPEEFAASAALLIVSSTLAWLWALLAQRRGRLMWMDSAGDVLAAAIGISGAVILGPSYLYRQSTAAPIIAGLGGAAMLIGAAVNFVQTGFQDVAKSGKRGLSTGYRIAILGQIVAALVWLLWLITLVDVSDQHWSGLQYALATVWMIGLSLPVFAIPIMAIRAKRRETAKNVDVKGLIALGVFTATLSTVIGILLDITEDAGFAVTLSYGIPGLIAGGFMVWGSLLNRRIVQEGRAEENQQP